MVARLSGIVLTHGAGSNCDSNLLRSLDAALSARGLTVLRRNMAYRAARPTGPPHPSGAAADRASLRSAVAELGDGVHYLGGHSYGARQSTMLAAEDPAVASALLLLSYPLHPPRKPEEWRTAHFPNLRTPALFVHGTRDPFGSVGQMERALELIPGRHALMTLDRAGHELRVGDADRIADAFVRFTTNG